MAINLKPADVAVIGLGAAGGVAVLPLARAGLKVVGIEAGTWMDPHSFKPDEIYNNVRSMVTSVPKAKREIPTFRTSVNERAQQGTTHPMMNAIGGTSIHYHAQSWRYSPWDFQVRSASIRRYGANSIPKGSTLEDWPLSYEDLENYYDIVEHEVGVSGRAGNIMGKLDPRGNVFEGPRRRDFPMPPLRDTEFTDMMGAAARKLGWKPFRGPAAINSAPYRGRPACAYHGYCDRGGCHISAKNSTAVTTIPEAVKTKNLTIADRSQVTRIVAGADGKVTGVTYIRDGKEYFQPAKVVLLASYTYENSRLLLLSKSKAYPNGLANNRAQVGRHYFGHWDAQAGTGVTALFPVDLNIWYGAIAQNVTVDEWADDNFDHSGLGFIGGASIQVNTEKHPIGAAAMATYGRAPQWGSKWKAFVRENAGRWVSAYVQSNTFPYENTFLDLDPEIRDPLGDPVCRVTSGPKESEPRQALYAVNKMEEWFRAAGAIEVQTPRTFRGPALTTHAFGGTRMGENPDTSVVDKWGFSHEAPNFGILGASVMGTSGARNPTLTVQALAWRTAERLVRNWKTISA
jgi:gluconate 2-dehydrogenase alpha chain